MATEPKSTTTKPGKKAAPPTGVSTAATDQQPDPKKERAKKISTMNADGVLPLAQTAAMFSRGLAGDDTDMIATFQRMLDVGEAVNGGSLATAERMLYAQASTLNTMFAELARRAAANMGQHLGATDVYLRLALKAQAQSRATVQTLAELKQPRTVAFVRQANIAQQQQVNNGAPAPLAPARETAQPANELLEDGRHEQQQRMAPGATAAPARGNPAMETVGAVNRAEDARGQGRFVG